MGLHLENDEDAGKVLERMMEKFEIDLDEVIEDADSDNDELNELRKNKS